MEGSTINKEIAEIIENNIQVMAQKLVELQYRQHPDTWNQYGDVGNNKGFKDAEYHLTYLAEALLLPDVNLFTRYTVWLKGVFKGLNLGVNVLKSILCGLSEILRHFLGKEQSAVTDEYISAALEALDKPLPPSQSYLSTESPFYPVARKYLDMVLNGERHKPIKLIEDTVKMGTGVKEIYLQVFQPCHYEIGRLWMENKISVGQEHFCSTVTQMIMSQLYPYTLNPEKKGCRCVLSCVGGELHQIGMHMVADFLEMDGWDTYFLGANTPPESISKMVKSSKADILGLSMAMSIRWRSAYEVIGHIRQVCGEKEVKILAGGLAFNNYPELWKKIGADGCAADADQAVETANALCG